LVRANSFDLLQADHTLSGIDVALWDLLGKKLGEPVYRLLGYSRACCKTAYASQLFGDDPQTTVRKAQRVTRDGFRAAKFGWGPYGRGTVEQDSDQVHAAREGLGKDGILLIDAGTIWGDDISAAEKRLPALHECGALWLEEPFVCGALDAYKMLSLRSGTLKLAGGEGCHDFYQAKNMIDFAGIGYVQIDAGRIGGISTAKSVADYAAAKSVQFVNHTFTTSLALSSSIQPYAGIESHPLCEYPSEPSPLAKEFCTTRLEPDAQGLIRLPEKPGLGLEPDARALKKYLVALEIRVREKIIIRSGELSGRRRRSSG
jgi:L-alanine-DL-glutamate epimerase-like enolase superfamily enzyme